jgi:acyl CoA:acetate/3-ketoacid CoA transferase alpha subunit
MHPTLSLRLGGMGVRCVYTRHPYGTRYTVGKETSALWIRNIEAIRFEAPMLL